MEQVHAAWLAAGALGDAQTMRRLLRQHPRWLHLQRRVEAPDAPAPRFCSWENFHLDTIGASVLHTAAWEGRLAVLELLLEAGQHPDARDDGALTPVMVAILRYNVVVTRCVFRDGEAVRRNLVEDCREEDDELLRGTMATIELLTRFGADVNARSEEGYSALHYVANGDGLELARFLVDAGADIDAPDQNGKTPLHQSICEKSLLVANFLVSQGARIDLKDSNGLSPLTLALHRGSMLQIVLNQHHLVATDERQDFAVAVLLSAVEYELEEAVRIVVEGGYTPVAVCDTNGETPLHRAIARRSPQLMELLADLDSTNRNLTARTLAGNSPTHYAAQYGSIRVLEILLQRLTRVFGDLRLLSDEANPLNATNDAGVTSLYLAGSRDTTINGVNERDAIVQLLLEHNARLFPRGGVAVFSESASIASVTMHERVRRCLAQWMAEVNGPSQEAEDDDHNHDHQAGTQTSDVLLTELCAEWMASVPSHPFLSTPKRSSNWADISALLLVVISAGYAHDFVPLLLELPLLRTSMPFFLARLERFARFSRDHLLLLQLHAELSEGVLENTNVVVAPC